MVVCDCLLFLWEAFVGKIQEPSTQGADDSGHCATAEKKEGADNIFDGELRHIHTCRIMGRKLIKIFTTRNKSLSEV